MRRCVADGLRVVEYIFCLRNEVSQAFLIQSDEGEAPWTLWYWRRGSRHVLCSPAGVKPKTFSSPEQCVAYCRFASESDADWSDFRDRTGLRNFPPCMGEEDAWLPTARLMPR